MNKRIEPPPDRYYLLAKKNHGAWIFQGEYRSLADAKTAGKRFAESMHFFQYKECTVAGKNDIENLHDPEWKTDAQLKSKTS